MRTLRGFFIGAECEAGQAIVLIAIVLLGMLMMVGLAIDAGQVYSARRAMQESADAAAYAAAVTLYEGGTQTQAFNAATADATTNGFTNGVGGTTITVRQPLTAPYNTTSYVEVIIVKSVRTSLVPAEAAITQVTVHAIAGADSLNNDYAIMALDRNATNDAFISSPTANINLTGGGVLVNSLGSTAADSSTPSGNWSISCPSTNPCDIDIAGGAAGTWPNAAPGSPKYFDGVRTGRPQVSDPFAGYPKPGTAGLSVNPAGFGSGGDTVQEGVYTSAIHGKNLCHGTYILKGGGMGGDLGIDTTSDDPTRPGQKCDGKVFIFNTMSNYPAVGGTCSGMVVSGNHDVTLLAMTTGTYKGMLFYQDPACNAAMSFGGTAFMLNATGTIYLPNAAFAANGQPTIDGGQVVAKTVDLGNATLNINYNPGTSAQPVLPRLAQ